MIPTASLLASITSVSAAAICGPTPASPSAEKSASYMTFGTSTVFSLTPSATVLPNEPAAKLAHNLSHSVRSSCADTY